MVTMQQIADRCGVSRGTVDRALHHKDGVREEVAERIRATAREMGYISNRLVMQQTRQWKIGVVLHSSHSMFVRMLCDLFASFSERELIPNVTVIVRSMYDMDIQHQLTLIDELVTSEHIDGLALMPLANTLVRDRINDLSEKMGIPVVTFNTDIADANRIAYVGPDNIAAGRAAAALMGMVMQGHGSVLPILGQRSGHYADSQRYTGFWAEMAENFPNIRVLHPECSFLVVVHYITDGNVRMVKKGTVDFIIGQDVKTQGTLPIRLLYDYLERHQFPKERMNMTDITIKFRGNV